MLPRPLGVGGGIRALMASWPAMARPDATSAVLAPAKTPWVPVNIGAAYHAITVTAIIAIDLSTSPAPPPAG